MEEKLLLENRLPSVCRLCLEVSFAEDLYPVEKLQKIFEVVLSDLDLKLSKDPAICVNCQNSLTSSYNFKNRCLENEQKIKQHYKKNNSYISLYDVVTNSIDSKKEFQNKEPVVAPYDFNSSESDMEFVEESCYQTLLKLKPGCENKENEHGPQDLTIQSLSIGNQTNSYVSIKDTDIITNWVNHPDNDKAKNETRIDDQWSILKSEEDCIINISDDLDSTEFEEKSQKTDVESHMYQCLNCHYESNSKINFSLHVLKHKNLLNCHLCHKTFKLKSYLDGHFLSKHKNIGQVEKLVTTKVHYCDFCQYKTVNKINFANHIVVKHKQIIKSTSKLKVMHCAHCKYCTTFKGSLIIHLRKHSVVNPFLCLFCVKSYTQIVDLRVHILNHHLSEIDPKNIDNIINKKVYRCKICEFRCTHIMKYKAHVIKHKEKVEKHGKLKET